MREQFVNVLGWKITFTDDSVTIEIGENVSVYPYGSIQDIKFTFPSALTIVEYEKLNSGKNKSNIFSYDKQHKDRLKGMISYTKERMRTAPRAQAEHNKKKVEPVMPKEFRKRCNVCGHVFCFTDADIEANQAHQFWAKAHAVGSLFGTQLDMYGQQRQMQAEQDKIVDYGKCPNCKSTSLTDISHEKLDGAKSKSENSQVQQKAGNVAEELKQFKELLDMGIITQEEFDAKKKQLLGL